MCHTIGNGRDRLVRSSLVSNELCLTSSAILKAKGLTHVESVVRHIQVRLCQEISTRLRQDPADLTETGGVLLLLIVLMSTCSRHTFRHARAERLWN